MSTLGWIALTLGSALLGVHYGIAPVWAAWGQLAAGVVLVVAGVWSVLRGRQHLTPVLTGLQGLPADERIVLFLRSFKDDDGFSQVAALRWFRLLFTSMLPTPAHLRTEEDQVARAVAPFGRMVALGRPSDRLPRLGAERSYASDATWQDEVLAALDHAALVLLVTGAGRSLAWEVDQVVGRDEPARLVLLVSRDRRQYEHFREALGDHFPNGLPHYPPARVRHRLLRGRYVRAAIWFDGDWTPHWEMLDGRFPLIGLSRRTQRALPRALQEVYRRAGVPARVPPTTPRPWAVKLSVPLLAAFWLGPLVWSVFAVGALGGRSHAPAGGLSPSLATPSGDLPAAGHNTVLDLLLTGWPLWLWAAVVAAFAYRTWRGGPYAVTVARLQGVAFPVFLLALVVSLALSPQGWLMFLPLAGLALVMAQQGLYWLFSLGLVLLVLGVVGMPVATTLLIRRDVREWIDSRL
ncbi:hypothetical protein [Streptomyces sp. NPDC093097]|uniref:hypothetical protein n=1 Tax=Streptomyces sp. NPDC093097 TaxID=3366027 RepID=UPI0037FFE452